MSEPRPERPPHVFLVDANNHLHRAYHQSQNQDPRYNFRPSDGMPTGAVRIFVSKLLQFTSGASYDEEKAVHVIHTIKVDALRRIVAKADGPVLVAVNFQHEQDRLRKAFPQAEFFRDATTPAAQAALKDRWNAGKVPVLVAHPKSVGHGLNLQHGGSTLVWTTLTYSREDYEQMICRLARRGQKKQVMVYRLIIPGTVDEVVASVVESKADNEAKLLNALTMLEALRNGG
jgi:hypothetical protein